MDCRVTVRVAAAPAVAWRVLADIRDWPRWNPSCAEAVVEGDVREGAQLDLRLLHPRGREFTTRPRLTAVEEPRRLAWTARALGLRVETEVELDPEEEGTLVTLTSSTRGPMGFAYRLAMRPRTQARMYVSMLDGLAADLVPA